MMYHENNDTPSVFLLYMIDLSLLQQQNGILFLLSEHKMHLRLLGLEGLLELAEIAKHIIKVKDI